MLDNNICSPVLIAAASSHSSVVTYLPLQIPLKINYLVSVCELVLISGALKLKSQCAAA